MEEVKIRAFSINTATNSPNGLPPPLIREYWFLQLRMLCELIALGCSVAHGDIGATQTKDLQKKWEADEILKQLEKLHPDFYPVPVKPTFGPGSVHLEEIESGFLTKAELIALYGRCGAVLHKGNLRNLISPRTPAQTGFADINDWGQKILNLLSAHKLTRLGSRRREREHFRDARAAPSELWRHTAPPCLIERLRKRQRTARAFYQLRRLSVVRRSGIGRTGGLGRTIPLQPLAPARPLPLWRLANGRTFPMRSGIDTGAMGRFDLDHSMKAA